MAILVTGGAGYIGSITTETLLDHGFPVVVYDSLAKGYRDSIHPDATFEQGDVGDERRLAEVFAKHSIDGVIHMAAFIEVGESMREPGKYLANNFGKPLALLEVMREAGTRVFVLSSTAATYGNPESVPIPESAPNRPVNPYGLSKLMLEQALACYTIRGLQYAALRYFNAAGATKRFGERHKPESHLIPLVLQAATGERQSIDIFGTDYDTPDGTCIRDYIHVRDLAEAHVVALRYLQDEAKKGVNPPDAVPEVATRAYNLGNGQGFSVREVIAAAEKVCGRRVPVRETGRRPGDPARLVASSEKMLGLGWRPKCSELEAIVESAWAWKQAHSPVA